MNQPNEASEASKFPSRRYTCKVCGTAGRRNNKLTERMRKPICPSCDEAFEIIEALFSAIIKSENTKTK
jgi:hypothetical protein